MRSTVRDCYGCPLSFLRLREQNASKLCWGPSTAYTTFLTNRLDLARNLYRKDLFAHFGCVNAIEFSHEGCWLISGGDDRRVLLWNLESTLSGKCKPTPMVEEHSSNIFCLGFDSLNSKIFSAGNDEQVIVHDVKTGETVNVFMHEEAIYGVSVDPYRDSVFASAGEDGQILIFDIRAPASAGPLLLARSYDAFHAVQFHPVEPTFVVTANSKEGVVLWDVRKPCVPFVKYGEKRCAESSSMCARFNSSGTQIIALRRRMHPVLFNTQSPTPVCEFDADHYYNSCTMKSCCFAGSTDEFVLSGSDDFNLYMWRIPDPHSEVNFIPDAHLILRGHRSIVNQVRFNNHNLTIASSGVEKIVKLWSPVAVPGSYGTLIDEKSESCMTRRVYTHEDYIGLVLDSGQTVSHDYSHGSTDEDPKMMAFFDSLVQREVEGWTTNTDLSDDDLEANSNPTHSSSSLPTSHSDDTDSDSAWVSSRQSSSCIRRRRLAASRGVHDPVVDAGERDLPTPGGRPKPGHGSEWILHLIAKKRAQLKAAKKNRRSVRRKKKSKARQFIRCFTSSRQYLYRPDNNRASASHCLNRAAPADLLRRRHVVAPYTMMSLGDLGDSDDDSDDDDDDDDSDENRSRGGSAATGVAAAAASLPPLPPPSSKGIGDGVLEVAASPRPSCETGSTTTNASSSNLPPRQQSARGSLRASYEIRFWSSDSSPSDEEEATKGGTGVSGETRKRGGSPLNWDSAPRVSCNSSDAAGPTSNDSENAIKGATTDINSLPCDPSAIMPTIHSVRTSGNVGSAPHAVMAGTANCKGDDRAPSSSLSGRTPSPPAVAVVTSPFVDFHEVSNGSSLLRRGIIPISAVSTDESGSVVFDLNQPTPSSLDSATFDLLNRVDFDNLREASSRERNTTNSDNSACNTTRYLSGLHPSSTPPLDVGTTPFHRRGDSSSTTGARKSARGQRSELSPRGSSAKRNPRQSDRPNRAELLSRGHSKGKEATSAGRFTNEEETQGLPVTSKEREDVASPSSCDGSANGEAASDGSSANTPDSGISVGDRGAKVADGSSSSESDRMGSGESRPPVKRKKISEFLLKSYWKRLCGSDDEMKDDLK